MECAYIPVRASWNNVTCLRSVRGGSYAGVRRYKIRARHYYRCGNIAGACGRHQRRPRVIRYYRAAFPSADREPVCLRKRRRKGFQPIEDEGERRGGGLLLRKAYLLLYPHNNARGITRDFAARVSPPLSSLSLSSLLRSPEPYTVSPKIAWINYPRCMLAGA